MVLKEIKKERGKVEVLLVTPWGGKKSTRNVVKS